MRNLFEGLETGDLARLIHPELHVDEFKSKLGDDQDVVVLSFKVDSKEPANDLVAFIEKGYEWVLDADISSGEMEDGSYIVFVELDRSDATPDNIMDLMNDLMSVTDQEISDWRVRYYKAHKEITLSLEALNDLIPLSPLIRFDGGKEKIFQYFFEGENKKSEKNEIQFAFVFYFIFLDVFYF